MQHRLLRRRGGLTPGKIELLPRRAVEAFLERDRVDYRAYKQLTREEIERRQRRLPIEPPFWRKLHLDQKVCFLVGAREPRFGFFSDPSTGKTLLALALFRYWRRLGRVRRALVLVPNLSNKTEWELEIRKHWPKLERTILAGSSAEKWAQIDDGAPVVVETYGGFTRMCCNREQDERRKRFLRPDRKRVRQLMRTFDAVICDECSEVKGHGSLIFRILRKLTEEDSAFLVLMLSGTPVGRDPHDLWAQMFLVDRGATLGETLTLYRAAFFSTTINHWGGYEHTFLKRRRRLLHDFLADRSLRYKVSEADLPKLNRIRKAVQLTEEQLDWFERAREELHAAGREHDKRRVESTFLRMRQLSSGFVGLPADEEGRRAKLVFDYNPKLELLGQIVASIPREYPIIIVHEFIISGEAIERELERLGIGSIALRGGIGDPFEVRERFERERLPLVMNWKAGGFGLNLQTAAYMIIYESPVSSIMRRQVEMRIRRRYSDWARITLYDLIALGTMDATILDWHKTGEDIFAALMDGRIS